ncbi:ribosome biogenesis protein [Grosmannia clavigera kw1407]|uniref:Pescadillo homolog n=1 Tax=Grosmannia clavigera (strain kw1407 / UAMH 11150) TaxID=655863 RepID=F0XU35_GROCL|nr:ribosome biogenesis protein [Grosmannia clavigera kw1407]EFW98879.1 ribosome biogenesis protein [Grosmannia clavigera kw1407]
MARPKRRGEAGAAKNYVTRNQAIRKLQLSLPDFRQLCIWKGIYPREPRSKKKVSKSSTASTTFYYTKDIQYLLHEPLVAKFREQKVLEKKISRALGRGDISDAKRFERNAARPEKTGKPRYTLDHVVRERYPTFADALRDLDDCLSMLFLFASLPATSSVPPKMIARCERLCLEFQHYLIVSHSLRKSFLSIKGIYYQATIQGEDVLWLVPYKFNQRVVGDIDFRIMGTFVEFYMTLLGFVNYRLYTAVGLKYPPRFDQTKDDAGGELDAFTLEGAAVDGTTAAVDGGEQKLLAHGPDPEVQAEVNKVVQELQEETGDQVADKAVSPEESELVAATNENENENENGIDKFEPALPGGHDLPQPSYSTSRPSRLFAKCTIYLSRETPRPSLEFMLRAFGCRRIGWDAVLGEGAFTTDELDPTITHQIVDRPPVQVAAEEAVAVTAVAVAEDNQTAVKLGPNRRVPGRIYVQPQWVWDSINEEELQRPDLYAPGAQLPPHLSPFVKSAPGQYDPSLPLELQQTEAEALASDVEDEEEDEEGEMTVSQTEKKKTGKRVESEDEDEDGGMDVAASEDDEDEDEDADEDEDENADEDVKAAVEEVDVGSDDGQDEEASEALQRQLELEAELAGKPVRSKQVSAKAEAKAAARKAVAKATRQKQEELDRAKGMLSKKKRRLYEQMMYSNNKRSAEDEKLRAKRRKIERKQAKEA